MLHCAALDDDVERTGTHRAVVQVTGDEIHAAPGSVERTGDGWAWRDGDRGLAIVVDGAATEVVTGDEERPLGFRSLGLEHREPSPTIVARVRATLPLTLTTRIEAGGS